MTLPFAAATTGRPTPVVLQFTVRRWGAWAPGLTDAPSWRAWARAPFLPQGDVHPPVAFVPAMTRRRLGPLGRMALEAAVQADGSNEEASLAGRRPVIFASQHGEVWRSRAMFSSIAQATAVSPTDFSMSVHNAIAGVYSITRADPENYEAISAGEVTVEMAFLEAASLLADGAGSVLVVVYDEPVPQDYRAFVSSPQAAYAWSCLLAPAAEAETSEADGADDVVQLSVRLEAEGNSLEPDDGAQRLPPGLSVFRAICGPSTVCNRASDGRVWRWIGNA